MATSAGNMAEQQRINTTGSIRRKRAAGGTTTQTVHIPLSGVLMCIRCKSWVYCSRIGHRDWDCTGGLGLLGII